MNDPKKFFGADQDSLRNYLGRLVNECYRESDCSMDATYRLARERMDCDRRLDHFDRDRLIEKVKEAGSNGAYLDLTDPYLFRAGANGPSRGKARSHTDRHDRKDLNGTTKTNQHRAIGRTNK